MANLSQQKRQRMMNFLSKLKEEHKDDDSVSFPLPERSGDHEIRRISVLSRL